MNAGRVETLSLTVLCLALFLSMPAWSDKESAPPKDMKLKGSEEGTVFKSLTVEGEDKIRIDFERPPLNIDLDPGAAPGLDWDGVGEILTRSELDLVSPLIDGSAYEGSPYHARPWLDQFTSESVARFRPAVEGVDRWRLIIANSKSETVAAFEGKGKPPEEIAWDGRTAGGAPAQPGLTYSYVLEAYDRAGNKRNFVGEGFELPSYRIETPSSNVMLFSGEELAGAGPGSRGGPASPILMEAASRINQYGRLDLPVRVEVAARTASQAKGLAKVIVEGLGPLLLGGVNRIEPVAKVQANAPAQGAVAIIVAE